MKWNLLESRGCEERNFEKSKNHLFSWNINREMVVPNKTVRVCCKALVYFAKDREENECWGLMVGLLFCSFRGTGTSHLLESNLSHVGVRKPVFG